MSTHQPDDRPLIFAGTLDALPVDLLVGMIHTCVHPQKPCLELAEYDDGFAKWMSTTIFKATDLAALAGTCA